MRRERFDPIAQMISKLCSDVSAQGRPLSCGRWPQLRVTQPMGANRCRA